MIIVEGKYAYVVGVDTHARTHTYAIINTATGARTGCEAFPVTAAGKKRALAWTGRNTVGPVLLAMGGAASHGASLTRTLGRADITGVEVKPRRKQALAGVGKTDATAAATGVLGILGMGLERHGLNTCCSLAPTV
ncbi:hypothetical protein ACIPUB_19870 [Paeniglutamicibacter sp. ORCA_105]|uniref:hypothetical protein n=1 Tax=Paeniglutamicibacter sp. ORCA_105 TaxID=3377336 RepID=UPI003894E365